MKQERQHVEGEQSHGEVLLSVAKIMLQMIALGFEDIVVFILAFPPGSCRRHDLGHGCIINGMSCKVINAL